MLVYKCPGPHAGPYGHTYNWKAIADKEDHKQALKDGWSDSLIDAVNKRDDEIEGALSGVDDTGRKKVKRAREDDGQYKADDPETPTNEAFEGGKSERDVLKEKADELGIEYKINIPTKKLKELIDAVD